MPERFYENSPNHDGPIRLVGDEAKHLARVRRVEVGEIVEVFDGKGAIWRSRVEKIDKESVLLARLEPIPDIHRAGCRLTLASAFPKGERVDWLVEKATEMGVDRLIPLITERSQVDPRVGKIDRLRRSVIEACKQCGRGQVLELEPPMNWQALATSAQPEPWMGWFCHPGGAMAADWPEVPPGSRIMVAVGPEGGFSEKEAEMARNAGWLAISLGRTLLRIETAAIAAACAVFHQCDRYQQKGA